MINRVIQKLKKTPLYSSVNGMNLVDKKSGEETKNQGLSLDDKISYDAMNNGVVDIYNYQNFEIMTERERDAVEQKIVLGNPEGEYSIK